MLKTIFIIGCILIALDMLYISFFKDIFTHAITNIQQTTIQYKIAGFVACYLFLILGLYYFIIRVNKSPFDAFLLGILIYGVYETTNYTLFNKWPLHIVIIDTLWGGILYSLTTIITYYIQGK